MGALAAGVGGTVGVGGGVKAKGGAGLMKFPPMRKTCPGPFKPLVINARPFWPQRINRNGELATLGIVIELIGVK